MERVDTFVLTRGLNASQVLSFVHELETFKADVFFEKRRTSANGKSVLGMMSLFTSIRLGDKVELKVHGEDKEAVARVAAGYLGEAVEHDNNNGYWEDEAAEHVERAMAGCMTHWNPNVRNIARSYLKTTRS